MIEIYTKENQAYGQFNNGEIIENKPIGFPSDNGKILPYSNLFYWAYAVSKADSTIGLHPHKGFEIITFVLKGSIKHYDTLINEWIELNQGDVQIIKSRSGIYHSEFLKKNSSIFQIWFDPNINESISKKAEYSDYKSSSFKWQNNKKTFIGKGSNVSLDTEDIEIFELIIDEDTELNLDCKKYYSIYVLSEKLMINNNILNCHDFVKISKENNISLKSLGKCKLFIISSPLNVSYKTYH